MWRLYKGFYWWTEWESSLQWILWDLRIRGDMVIYIPLKSGWEICLERYRQTAGKRYKVSYLCFFEWNFTRSYSCIVKSAVYGSINFYCPGGFYSCFPFIDIWEEYPTGQATYVGWKLLTAAFPKANMDKSSRLFHRLIQITDCYWHGRWFFSSVLNWFNWDCWFFSYWR